MNSLLRLLVLTAIVVIWFVPGRAQVARVRVALQGTQPVDCITRIDQAGKSFEVSIPEALNPTISSSLPFTVGSEPGYTVLSFAYNPSHDRVACEPAQNGLEIRFSTSAKIDSPDGARGNQMTGAAQMAVPVLQNAKSSLRGPAADPNSAPLSTGTTDSGASVATASSPTARASGSTLSDTVAGKAKEVKKEAADLSVPESPGFTILGLTPQTVIRPSTPRELATSLINSVDENGNIQSGIAVDTVPYLLFFGSSVSLGDKTTGYRARTTSGYLTRLISRTQVSLATTKGSSDADKSAKLGLGLHLVLFDRGDPRLDTELDNCFNKVVATIRAQAAKLVPDLSTSAEMDRYEATLESLVGNNRSDYKECIDASKKRNFNRSSMVVGGAGSWISESGLSSNFKSNGAGFWTSLAYGFEGLPGLEKTTQLILHFRRREKEQVPDPLNEGMFTTKDSNLFGGRLRFGVPNLTGNIEAVYEKFHFGGQRPDSSLKLSFGSDYRLTDNLYLNFSIGGETKKSNISNNKIFVRTSFNWGVAQKPIN